MLLFLHNYAVVSDYAVTLWLLVINKTAAAAAAAAATTTTTTNSSIKTRQDFTIYLRKKKRKTKQFKPSKPICLARTAKFHVALVPFATHAAAWAYDDYNVSCHNYMYYVCET